MQDDKLNNHVLQPVNALDPAVRTGSGESGQSQALAKGSGSEVGAQTAQPAIRGACIVGTTWRKQKDHPDLLEIIPGALLGSHRILTATKPRFDSYIGEHGVNWSAYPEPRPCPCCGEPRGAGSLHI